jgi:hypothetical protein
MTSGMVRHRIGANGSGKSQFTSDSPFRLNRFASSKLDRNLGCNYRTGSAVVGESPNRRRSLTSAAAIPRAIWNPCRSISNRFDSSGQALAAIGVCFVDRIYPPIVTLRAFLSEVLNIDHSCRTAIASLIAQRASERQQPCSPESGAYCQARKRFPENFSSCVTRSLDLIGSALRSARTEVDQNRREQAGRFVRREMLCQARSDQSSCRLADRRFKSNRLE